MYLTISPDTIDLAPGTEVIVRNQTWAEYEVLLQSRREQAAIKLSFNGKTQEIAIVSPSPRHANQADVLTDLVKLLLRHQKLDWQGFDPVTLKRVNQAGVEPDACFYIQNRAAILGKDQIDLAIDPPPDLAIEVDLTSRTNPEVYSALRIPELWIYCQATLSIFQFNGSAYEESPNSATFPAIDVKQHLPGYVERTWSVGSSVALREFEEWLIANR